MRAVHILVTGLILLTALAGCGQKGPLYREAPGESTAEASAAPAETGSRDVRDDEDAGD